MKIIDDILRKTEYPPSEEKIVKRVIHATADFEFAHITLFSPGVVAEALRVLQGGNCKIVTDTRMILAGINRYALEKLGVAADCFVDRDEVREMARNEGITRSMAAIRFAAADYREAVFIVGNAPTALYEIMALCSRGELKPPFIIGVPVGFVGAAESKEALWQTALPCITTKGRRGGSTVAVSIINALMYLCGPEVRE